MKNFLGSIFPRSKNMLNASPPELSSSETAPKTLPMDTLSTQIPSDNPITSESQDLLRRTEQARIFVENVLNVDSRSGLVVGVLGPWGSGKTSFINLSRQYFQSGKSIVIDFNPWMFSGASQLVDYFFGELAAQLRSDPKYSSLADDFQNYGELFATLKDIPFLGAFFGAGSEFAKAAGKILDARRGGMHGRREKTENALKALENPIIVVLDDIDRLGSAEVRDIFKLVRLTASFPNMIYVLAFDRIRVEAALSHEGINGRDYLEKILQVAVDLPEAPQELLDREILKAIDDSLSAAPAFGPFDKQIWPDVFAEVIRPLVRNMRDVRRYITSAMGSVRALGTNIALVDLLAIEAIRVFVPDTFRLIANTTIALTKPIGSNYRNTPYANELKEQLTQLIEASGSRKKIVSAFLAHIFPVTGAYFSNTNYSIDWYDNWLRYRRLAHPDILMQYLDRIQGKSLTSLTYTESAFALMAYEDKFESVMQSVPLDILQGAISNFEIFEDEFSPEHAVPVSVVLLNLLPKISENDILFLGIEPSRTVMRVVLRLLKKLPESDDQRAISVRATYDRLKSFYAKHTLLDYVGHMPDNGQKLISSESADAIESEWRNEVRSASVDKLIAESNVLNILWIAKKNSKTGEPSTSIPDEPHLTRAIFNCALGFQKKQIIGRRAVTREAQLKWDLLVDLFGNESEIKSRFRAMRVAGLTLDPELEKLFEQYFDGWRPTKI